MSQPTREPVSSHEPLELPSDRDSSGRDLGAAELSLLGEVIRSGHLNSTGGTAVPRLEAAFAKKHGVAHAIACASGSAAIHAALGALQLRQGDEVVTTSITDMGAVLPIAYEGATPVYADVDPTTANVTLESVTAACTENTRAIIVTHLFGQPADTAAIRAFAEPRGIKVIDDSAQAFLATRDGRLCGTDAHVGCFSFQQGKHMTTGEGGIVIGDDDAMIDGVRRFVNKGWGYGDTRPDHDRPGMNYRLTELQGAVGIAQLEKLGGVVQRRRRSAAQLIDALTGLDGIELPHPEPGTEHSYWRFVLRIDPSRVPGGPDAVAARLGEFGIGSAPRYIKKPAFECAVFRDPAQFGSIGTAGQPRHDAASHPGTYRALERMLVLPWNEHFTEDHVAAIARSIRAAVEACRQSR